MREGEVWKIDIFHSFKMLALLSGIIKSTVCWSASRHFDNCSLTAISKLIALCFSQGALYAEWEFSRPLVCCWWSGDGPCSVGRSCQVICSIIVGPFTLLSSDVITLTPVIIRGLLYPNCQHGLQGNRPQLWSEFFCHKARKEKSF